MEDYTTLGSLVEEFIIEKGMDTIHDWPRLYNIALRGLKNLHYDVSGEPTFIQLELDEYGLADVPTGVVKVRELVFMSHQGLVPIAESKTKNPWTTKKGKEVPPAPTNSAETSVLQNYKNIYSSDVDAARYKNGESVGHVFAGAEGNPYIYRRNYDTNKFEFSSNINGPIFLDCIMNPLEVNSKFRVHPLSEQPILYWLEWKDKQHRPNVPLAEKQLLKKQYYDAKRHSKMQFNSRSLRDIRNGQRKNYSLTIK